MGCRGSRGGKGQTCGCQGYFQGGGSDGYSIWVVDMDDDPPHGPGPGGSSSTGWTCGSQGDIPVGFSTEFFLYPPLE